MDGETGSMLGGAVLFVSRLGVGSNGNRKSISVLFFPFTFRPSFFHSFAVSLVSGLDVGSERLYI